MVNVEIVQQVAQRTLEQVTKVCSVFTVGNETMQIVTLF